jgi:hypothetical protein
MVALGQESIDALDGLAVRRGAELEGFVMIDEGSLGHECVSRRESAWRGRIPYNIVASGEGRAFFFFLRSSVATR